MRRILAIDPGNKESAYVALDLDEHRIVTSEKVENAALLGTVEACAESASAPFLACVIEKIASFGMAVGEEVFETVYWTGRFAERWTMRHGTEVARLPRMAVKMHLCHSSRAKDANIRQALIDRFGGKAYAVGTKRVPGPLYGISGDQWAALAVALTYADQNRVALAELAITKHVETPDFMEASPGPAKAGA